MMIQNGKKIIQYFGDILLYIQSETKKIIEQNKKDKYEY